MIELLFVFAVSGQPPNTDTALELCKPLLARKIGGEISTIGVDSAHAGSAGLKIRGRLTASYGMGPTSPGSARTHHFGRADLSYSCRVQHGRVREAAVNPLRP